MAKIAVIGAGITGLSAAWLLGSKHEVTLFEAEGRLGGHANTVEVEARDGSVPIDTGFIVYNTASYPNLIALFEHLDVPTAASDMSFAVSLDAGRYEYCGNGLSGLVGHPSNLARISHWQLMREIFRFFREARAFDPGTAEPSLTLGQWLERRRFSKSFVHAHIVPMGSAIWSAPADEMLAFPFAAFVRFFSNHGLLQTFDRPPWRTVKGGSREYVGRVARQFKGRVATGDPVVHAIGGAHGVTIATRSGASEKYDAALLACHADAALKITDGPESGKKNILSAFRYAPNSAVLHTDARLMPRRRRLWSSWNYLGSDGAQNGQRSAADGVSVTYWMNRLQPLNTQSNYFVSLNPSCPIADGSTIARFEYRHPMFDAAALAAQAKLSNLQGRNSLWFAGSYFGYGFHEDGVQSGLAAAEDLSARIGGGAGAVVRPWAWDKRQSRVAFEAPRVSPVLEVSA